MKTFAKQFAIIALLWAIFSPPIFHVLSAAHGHSLSRTLHTMAQYLRSALPQEPASETSVVSLPAQQVSNSVKMLDGVAEDTEQRSAIHAGETIISSAVIIILSICILRTCKRDANLTAT